MVGSDHDHDRPLRRPRGDEIQERGHLLGVLAGGRLLQLVHDEHRPSGRGLVLDSEPVC